MNYKIYTDEQLLTRWEDQRAVKNLMGIYANLVVQNREGEMLERIWSAADDISLMFNNGAYVGRHDVDAYYTACVQRNRLVAKLMQQRLPNKLGGMSEEEIYGVGPFKALPMSCPIIEIADDGKTAKGLWFCQGTYSNVEACGPASYWTFGYYAADFKKEDGRWKLWHLQYLNDIDCLCGQSWAEPQTPYDPIPEFAPLADFAYPEYTVKKQFRALYTKDRAAAPAPEIPVPYATFDETFSYGVIKEADA